MHRVVANTLEHMCDVLEAVKNGPLWDFFPEISFLVPITTAGWTCFYLRQAGMTVNGGYGPDGLYELRVDNYWD